MSENNLESVRDVLPDQRSARSRHFISICIPVYNEQDNIPALLQRLGVVAQTLAAKYDFEFLFTEHIGRIFNNVRGHPLAVVEKVIEKGMETAYSPPDVRGEAGQ